MIKALREKDTDISIITGSSIGALVGACYAKNADIGELEELILDTDWKKLLQLADLNLAFAMKGFVQGKKVKELLRTILGDVEFNDLKIPFAAVATDLGTGKRVVLDQGPVLDAVRASISIPVIFTPVKKGDGFLIDGGLVDPLPVELAADMGAERVIASNVIQSPEKRRFFWRKAEKTPKVSSSSGIKSVIDRQVETFVKENRELSDGIEKFFSTLRTHMSSEGEASEEAREMPNIFDVMMQALYSMEYEAVRAKKKKTYCTITPPTEDISSLEFFRGEEAINAGYEATMKAFKESRIQ